MYNQINIKLAGVTFENRQETIARLSSGEPCQLIPEPENQFDKNAIAVFVTLDGEPAHIGYVPRQLAEWIAPLLKGETIGGKVTEITGGFNLWEGRTAPYGVVIHVAIPNTTYQDY